MTHRGPFQPLLFCVPKLTFSWTGTKPYAKSRLCKHKKYTQTHKYICPHSSKTSLKYTFCTSTLPGTFLWKFCNWCPNNASHNSASGRGCVLVAGSVALGLELKGKCNSLSFPWSPDIAEVRYLSPYTSMKIIKHLRSFFLLFKLLPVSNCKRAETMQKLGRKWCKITIWSHSPGCQNSYTNSLRVIIGLVAASWNLVNTFPTM